MTVGLDSPLKLPDDAWNPARASDAARGALARLRVVDRAEGRDALPISPPSATRTSASTASAADPADALHRHLRRREPHQRTDDADDGASVLRHRLCAQCRDRARLGAPQGARSRGAAEPASGPRNWSKVRPPRSSGWERERAREFRQSAQDACLCTVGSWPVANGVFFNGPDEKSYAAVAVLGQTVVDSLLADGGDPVGRYVLINNVPFQVIGVMSVKGANAAGMDSDDPIFIPLSTGMRRTSANTTSGQ